MTGSFIFAPFYGWWSLSRACTENYGDIIESKDLS